MKNRITPNSITSLDNNQIFVFGSNEKGIHGAGAAAFAMNFGAEYGKGIGHYGNTYAIPTKDINIETLPVEKIAAYVKDFINYARIQPNLTFLVTEIGCGLAGYSPEDIAPLFKDALEVMNICLPYKFWQVLTDNQVYLVGAYKDEPIDEKDINYLKYINPSSKNIDEYTEKYKDIEKLNLPPYEHLIDTHELGP